MKRLFSLLFSLVLVLSMSPGVRADIIYIPEDAFLEDHMAQCTEIRRSFLTLTEVKVYQSPESDKVQGTLPEGDSVFIYSKYTDSQNNDWGYIEDYEANVSGWLPMVYVDLIYDYISFEEDYGHLFVHGDWITLDEAYAGQEIWLWRYPGSESGYTYIMDAEYPIALGPTYTDPEGRTWGYVNYHMGHRNEWICISDPTADFAALYPDGAPEVEITEPGETDPTIPEAEIKPAHTPMRLGVGFGVAVCVLVTVLVLVRRKKKNS